MYTYIRLFFTCLSVSLHTCNVVHVVCSVVRCTVMRCMAAEDMYCAMVSTGSLSMFADRVLKSEN